MRRGGEGVGLDTGDYLSLLQNLGQKSYGLVFISAYTGIVEKRGSPGEILRRKTLKGFVTDGYVEDEAVQKT